MTAVIATSGTQQQRRRKRRRTTSTTVMPSKEFWLLLSVLLVYSDSDLLAPNLTQCARSLHMTDLERDQQLGGGLSLGLFLVGAPAAFLIGVLADGCIAKTRLLSVILLIGGAGCIWSSTVGTYTELFLARSLTGVSLAGAFPLTYALVADWYPPSRRTILFSQLDIMGSIGVLLGQSMSGWVGPSLGWRIPFIIVGVPMILASLLVYHALYLAEKLNDKQASQDDKEKEQLLRNTSPSQLSIRQWVPLLKRPTYWLLLVQGIPGCVPWSVLCTFWPDYLHVNMGYTVEQATWVVLSFKVGVLVGIWATGRLGQYLYALSTGHPPVFMFVIGMIRIPLTVQLFDPSQQSIHFLCIIALVSGVLAAPTGTLVRAMVSHITEPTQRGMAYASFVLTDDIGRGAGPVLVAHWIAQSNGQRQPAFVHGVAQGWIWNSVFAGLTYFTVRQDEQDVKEATLKLPVSSFKNMG